MRDSDQLRRVHWVVRLIVFLCAIYAFLAAISLFGSSIKLLGKDTAESLFRGNLDLLPKPQDRGSTVDN